MLVSIYGIKHYQMSMVFVLKHFFVPRRLVMGIMMSTMFMSMWIPNSASAAIMAPIVLAVVDVMQRGTGKQSKYREGQSEF